MRQELQQEAVDMAGHPASGGGLFPPAVRKVLLGIVVAIGIAGLYLIAVRGPAILFDLAGGIGSLCF